MQSTNPSLVLWDRPLLALLILSKFKGGNIYLHFIFHHLTKRKSLKILKNASVFYKNLFLSRDIQIFVFPSFLLATSGEAD